MREFKRIQLPAFALVALLITSADAQLAHATDACEARFMGVDTSLVLPGSVPFERLISKRNFDSPELQAIFLRRGAGPADPRYINNMVETMIHFDQWLRGEIRYTTRKTPFHNMPEYTWPTVTAFEQLLTRLHTIAVLGPKGESTYWPDDATPGGFSDESVRRRAAENAAGQYRHMDPRQRQNEALVHHHELSPETFFDLMSFRKHATKKLESLGSVPMQFFVPQIRGIPERALPKYTIIEAQRKAIYSYPSPSQLKAYLQEMGLTLDRVRANLGLYEAPTSRADLTASATLRQRILEDLAHYYHLGVIGHPFMRVNNSVLMGQVNTVLLHLDLKPIQHGDMDYVVRSLDSEDAARYFIDQIVKAQ